MSGKSKINKVYKAQKPAPAHHKKEYEHNDVHNALCAKHNAQPHQTFNNPAHKGDKQQQNLHNAALAVEPLIKRHKLPP